MDLFGKLEGKSCTATGGSAWQMRAEIQGIQARYSAQSWPPYSCMRYALETGSNSTHACHTAKPPVLNQHIANSDAVADMVSHLRVCTLPKLRTPEGAAESDGIVFYDSGV